jgi:hypothetical protein
MSALAGLSEKKKTELEKTLEAENKILRIRIQASEKENQELRELFQRRLSKSNLRHSTLLESEPSLDQCRPQK